MTNNFHNLQKQFSSHTPLILGFSGGPDSVFCGQKLYDLSYNNITIVHFNHKLRGIESDQDEKFSEKMAKKWNFDFIAEFWKQPYRSEEKARIRRKIFFEKTRQQKKAKAIILAHHQDDAIETIFFNFLRGTGIKGLAGLKEWDPETKIFRPLLQIQKQEILDYLKKNQIPYQIDKTNLESNYSRNFLRNKVIPLIITKFPEMKNNIFRNSQIFRNLDNHFEKETKKYILEIKGEIKNSYNKKKFLKLSKFSQSEILREIFCPKNLDFKQIQELLEFIEQGKSGKKKILSKKTVQIFGDNFFIN